MHTEKGDQCIATHHASLMRGMSTSLYSFVVYVRPPMCERVCSFACFARFPTCLLTHFAIAAAEGPTVETVT